MKNHELIVKQEVSFNIMLGAPEERPGNGHGRDPFDNESLTNPRQWVHMDAKVHKNTILVTGYFSGKKETNGDYTIDKASFSVISVDSSSSDLPPKFYDIYPDSFTYCSAHEKKYQVRGATKTVPMKKIAFKFNGTQSSSGKTHCEYKNMSPFTVKNGELIDFHVLPKEENKIEENLTPEEKRTVNGHICQGKFYIHP